MSAPTSKEVHRIARDELRSTFASLGFRPSRQSGGGWVADRADGKVRFWLQLSKWNQANSPDGCEFTAELAIERVGPGAGARLFALLTDDEREEHRTQQNLVIAKLPLDEAELDRLPPEWQADRLAQVAPRLAPYPVNEDVWFRYVDEVDVRDWMAFIRRVIPGAVDRLTAVASSGGVPAP